MVVDFFLLSENIGENLRQPFPVREVTLKVLLLEGINWASA